MSIGPRIFSGESSWLLNKSHLAEAHRFYERHGRKTIILARFLPIIRTFAPFVAGIGQMPFARFIGFSVSGGILWVVTVSLAGFYFNQIEFVRTHFQLVVLAIIVISVIPACPRLPPAAALPKPKSPFSFPAKSLGMFIPRVFQPYNPAFAINSWHHVGCEDISELP